MKASTKTYRQHQNLLQTIWAIEKKPYVGARKKPISLLEHKTVGFIFSATVFLPFLTSCLYKSTSLLQSWSFHKLWNPGQTSVWFSLAQGEKHIEQLREIYINFDKSTWKLREIHFLILTNPYINSEKSIYWSWQIHLTTYTNPTWAKFIKSSDLRTDMARQWSNFSLIKILVCTIQSILRLICYVVNEKTYQ